MDDKTHTPTVYLVEVILKDGEICHEQVANKSELEVLVAEINSDKHVAGYTVYEQIKSSFPAPSASGDQQ